MAETCAAARARRRGVAGLPRRARSGDRPLRRRRRPDARDPARPRRLDCRGVEVSTGSVRGAAAVPVLGPADQPQRAYGGFLSARCGGRAMTRRETHATAEALRRYQVCMNRPMFLLLSL